MSPASSCSSLLVQVSPWLTSLDFFPFLLRLYREPYITLFSATRAKSTFRHVDGCALGCLTIVKLLVLHLAIEKSRQGSFPNLKSPFLLQVLTSLLLCFSDCLVGNNAFDRRILLVLFRLLNKKVPTWTRIFEKGSLNSDTNASFNEAQMHRWVFLLRGTHSGCTTDPVFQPSHSFSGYLCRCLHCYVRLFFMQ